MTLYYVTRDDKNGDRLTTSYDTKVKADKYGVGENRKPWTGVRYLDDKGQKTDTPTDNIIRSVISIDSTNMKHDDGNFVIYHMDEDAKWVPTSHRYTSYGLANTAMKSFRGVYFDMMVVEEPKIREKNPIVSDEDAPF